MNDARSSKPYDWPLFEPVPSILELDSDSFVNRARAAGVVQHDALSQYRAFYRNGTIDHSPVHWPLLSILRKSHAGRTIKFCLRVGASLESESVIIPRQRIGGGVRRTLCVSSQVGCALGCTFCETAQMGFMQNLTTAQIIAQWFSAVYGGVVDESATPARISNIVFMGMGEPMDNLDAVLGAIRVLTDRNGPEIAPANITVSTVGRTAGIRRYAAFARCQGFRRLKLAVSINAPNDAIRSSIMPINRAESMDKLMAAMLDWTLAGGMPILIEYVIIPGVNDAHAHADELAAYLEPLRCKVNLIPYNPRRDSPWPSPDDRTVNQFHQRLHDAGLLVMTRRTHGCAVMAACGQLGNPHVRQRRFIPLVER